MVSFVAQGQFRPSRFIFLFSSHNHLCRHLSTNDLHFKVKQSTKTVILRQGNINCLVSNLETPRAVTCWSTQYKQYTMELIAKVKLITYVSTENIFALSFACVLMQNYKKALTLWEARINSAHPEVTWNLWFAQHDIHQNLLLVKL